VSHGEGDDLLWRQLKTIPAFRALLRAVEARFYQAIDLPGPALDVGCGDGHFAQMTFDRPLAVGIDPWWGPLWKAQRSGMYAHTLAALGDNLPFPDHTFASAISNSVLEHIPAIQPVLNEVGRVLQPGAPFVMTMPGDRFTQQLGGARFFERLGLPGLANHYRALFNRISRHAHTDPPEVWAERLAQAGFVVERWQPYFSTGALHALEWGHVQGLPAAILHALTGHWIVAPWESSLRRTEQWLRPYFEEPFPADGTYLLIIARKQADGPIPAMLPAPRPFTTAELTTGAPAATIQTPAEPAPVPAPPPAQSPQPTPPPPTAPPSPRATRYPPPATLFLLLALFAAAVGQSILRADPGAPGRGLRWWLIGAAAALLFTALQRQAGENGRLRLPRLPTLRGLSRRRWLVPAALLLALIAQRLVNPAAAQRPLLALLTWLLAIGLAAYALWPATHSPVRLRAARFTLAAAGTLFAGALLARLVNLGGHPFILNGSEANLGLDALSVLSGALRSPFSTGWLTNPTLPLYLLALPLRLLGPSTLAIRLVSPFIGALTVVAVYLLGQRLWGRAVGLTAAVLLAGSHVHLHYSRLGLTNGWDALLTLLALGLLGLAWQRPPDAGSRLRWLAAGLAIGLNAYLFTSSRLLPLMLLALLAWALLFDRRRLATWLGGGGGRHLLAAALLALVVALPQLLYYQANPGVFMERANALGILPGQSDWLSQEAARAGRSELDLLSQQFWRAALAFNATLDASPAYGPPAPLLNSVTGVLFVVGLLLALARLGQPRHALLLAWVLVTVIFGGALLENPPNSQRLIIAVPAVCLLAALALVEVGRALLAQWPPPQTGRLGGDARAWLTALCVAGALLLAVADLFFYFGPYRAQHRFGDRNTEAAFVLAGYLNDLDGAWTAYFYGPPSMYVGFPTIPFLARDFRAGSNLFDAPPPGDSAGGAPPPPETPNQVHILLPERAGELSALQERWGNGRVHTISGYYADPLLIVYELGPGSAPP